MPRLTICFIVGFLLWLGLSLRGAPGDGAEAIPGIPTEHSAPSAAAIQSDLQTIGRLLEQQQQNTLAQLDQLRKETDAGAKRNGETMTARFGLLEQALDSDRDRQIEGLRASNRLLLLGVSSCAALGFAGLLIMAIFLIRTFSRLSRPAVTVVEESPRKRLPPEEGASSWRSREADSLAKRVHDLETAVLMPKILSQSSPKGLEEAARPPAAAPLMEPALALVGHHQSSASVPLLLGKAHALLNLDEIESALNCIEEALAIEPANADALVKKGLALERLRRMDEAIESYDRAIAVNRSLTMAYLYKGRVCNRLERHHEALECYEQALRSEQKN